jgi:prophage regulatory protein
MHMPQEPERLLRMDQLVQMTGFSRTTLWRLEKAGQLPPNRIFGRSKVWLGSEIRRWMETLPKKEKKR